MRPYFPALDGLRALSVVLVITQHMKGPEGLLRFVPGWIGVDIFFILSGFLITTLLIREEDACGHADMRAFYIRRAFRILPVYLFTLGIYVLLNLHRGGAAWAEMHRGLPYYLTFMNEFSPVSVFSFTWTLGYEEKFYLLWPVLGFVLFRHWRMTLALTLYGLLLAVQPFSAETARSYSGLMLGALLAVFYQHPRALPTCRRLLAPSPVWVWIAVIAMTQLCIYNGRFIFFFDLAMAWLLLGLVSQPHRFGAMFLWPPVIAMGRRTYSMYLIHGLVLGSFESMWIVQTAWSRVGLLVAVTAVTLAAAQGMYLTIEKPFQRLGRRAARYTTLQLPSKPAATS
jgi:peptidoglycan/LPS O-acetylase OafA/YrhL